MSLSESRATICSEVRPSGIVTACCTTLPSTMVPMTSRKLAFFWNRVFAGLEFGARLQRKHAADERPAIVVDHAFTLQHIGNVGHSGARPEY